MADILRVNNLFVSFGGVQALSNVSLKVGEGEIFGIVGPNGAGKTVLLNCINGVYRPGKGEVIFDGSTVTGLPRHKMASLGMGRTFQHCELFQRMTVIENTLLGRHIYLKTNLFSGALFWGPGRREELKARKKAEEVLDFLDLYMYRKELIANLPYGTQKIVGLARALAGEPRLLLVDELGSGLMRQEKEDVARFLLRIHYELGTTIVWIEHDMQMVTDICDRLVCLHFGQIIREGTVKEVMSDSRVIEAYTGKMRCDG